MVFPSWRHGSRYESTDLLVEKKVEKMGWKKKLGKRVGNKWKNGLECLWIFLELLRPKPHCTRPKPGYCSHPLRASKARLRAKKWVFVGGATTVLFLFKGLSQILQIWGPSSRWSSPTNRKPQSRSIWAKPTTRALLPSTTPGLGTSLYKLWKFLIPERMSK